LMVMVAVSFSGTGVIRFGQRLAGLKGGLQSRRGPFGEVEGGPTVVWWAGSESNTRHKDFQCSWIPWASARQLADVSSRPRVIKGFWAAAQLAIRSFTFTQTDRTVTLPPQRTATARRIDNPLRSHFALILLGLLSGCGRGVAVR
jgi:hypothetical protein